MHKMASAVLGKSHSPSIAFSQVFSQWLSDCLKGKVALVVRTVEAVAIGLGLLHSIKSGHDERYPKFRQAAREVPHSVQALRQALTARAIRGVRFLRLPRRQDALLQLGAEDEEQTWPRHWAHEVPQDCSKTC